MDFAIQGEHQSHRMLRNRVGRISRNAHHHHAQILRRVQIDVIETRAAQCDQTRALFGETIQNRGVELIINKSTNGGKICGERAGFFRQTRLEKGELMIAGLIGGLKKLAVVRLGAEQSDLQSILLILPSIVFVRWPLSAVGKFYRTRHST